ncbi:MAG: hypothetical protein ACI9S8_000986 [Chlamydiales bacterium]|jgi:hypothetical protein
MDNGLGLSAPIGCHHKFFKEVAGVFLMKRLFLILRSSQVLIHPLVVSESLKISLASMPKPHTGSND